MKKFLCIFLTIIILLSFPVYIFASESYNGYTFTFSDTDITVYGDVNEDEAYSIAYSLYCDEKGIDRPMICTPYDISGHYTQTTYSTITDHKVRSSSPRCDRKKYKIVTCTKCSSILSKTLISTTKIECC